jgi:AcrR family transcriptional regulator
MPRVSDQHLAARRAQILEAARGCFAREGFHRTSMADILGAAGLSAGAVYRYFRSKEELVAAIAGQAGEGLRERLAEVSSAEPAPPPAEVLEAVLAFVDSQARPEGSLRIALQVWAEALRDPALAGRVEETYAMLRDGLVVGCRRAQEAGSLGPDADPDAIGRVLVSLVPGYVLRRLLMSDPLTPAAFVADLRPLLEAGAGPHRVGAHLQA